MNPLVPVAIVAMFAALACYSIDVWGEKLSGRLKSWQLVFFWVGLALDTTGTTLMTEIAGKFDFDFHGLTGALAIALMILHAVWATAVLWLKRDALIASFHRFSLSVWAAWLVPFLSGLILAMLH